MKRILYGISIIFCFLLILIACQGTAVNPQDNTSTNPISNKGTAANEEANTGEVRPANNQTVPPDISKTFTEADLRYKGEQIKITHHARCRMGCRKIEAFEIQEVIDQRRINNKKTNRNPAPGKCPSIAYEGRTARDEQKIRVILGECEDRPIVITVIDLENEYRCNCK